MNKALFVIPAFAVLAACQSAPVSDAATHSKLVLEETGTVRTVDHAGVPNADGTVRPLDNVKMPDIQHIAQGGREDMLYYADVIFFWNGDSNFGNLIFKHNGRWYAGGGFIGGAGVFIRDEAKLKAGTVIFVTDNPKPFNDTKNGPAIAFSICRLDGVSWKFYYVEKAKFGEMPTYRDYYDEQNKKILYWDY